MYAVKQQSSNFIITIAAPVPIKGAITVYMFLTTQKSTLTSHDG
jgi:hypothetical protein